MADSKPTEQNDDITYTTEQLAEDARREDKAKQENSGAPNPRETSPEGPVPAVPPLNVPTVGTETSTVAPSGALRGEVME